MGARRPVIVMTLLATPFLLTAKGAAPAAGERRLPLRESLEGSVAVAPAPAPVGRCLEPALLVTHIGRGRLSHVGEVAFTRTHCTYLTAGGEPTGRYGAGQMVMVTPAGDEIHAECRGVHYQDGLYHESTQIVGGTGPYVDAIGHVSGIVTVDMMSSGVSIKG